MRSRREMSYRRVSCLLCTELGGCGLVYIRRPCGIGVGQSQGPEPSRLESSDPMREAGGAEHERVVEYCLRSCARPTGCKHGRTIRGPAQRFEGAKRRTAPGTKGTQRGRGQYSGWGPTPSFTAARESYPSRELLQRCYMSVYRG